jgi:hypothetical protein
MKSVAGGRKTWRHACADGNLETLVEQEDEAKTNALATDTRSPIEPKCPAMMADVRQTRWKMSSCVSPLQASHYIYTRIKITRDMYLSYKLQQNIDFYV